MELLTLDFEAIRINAGSYMPFKCQCKIRWLILMKILFCILDVIGGKLYHAKLDSLELESKNGNHNSEHFCISTFEPIILTELSLLFFSLDRIHFIKSIFTLRNVLVNILSQVNETWFWKSRRKEKNVMTSIKEERVWEAVECFQRRGASVKQLMSHRKYWAVSKGKKDMGRKKDTHTHTHTHTHTQKGTEKRQTGPTEHSTEQRFQSHPAVSFSHPYLVGRLLNTWIFP